VVAPTAAETPDWVAHPENQWVQRSPHEGAPAPPFGWEGSGDYDPHLRRWIHFGGHDGIPQGFPLFTYDLDTGRWQQRFPNTSPPGCCCVDGANVFDVANRRFVHFPGAALGHGYQWSRGVKLKSSAVWLYDGEANTWTNMRPPPYHQFQPRQGLGSLNAGATYDANHELALRFGGQASAGGTNNLFAYDAYANALHRLGAANPPSPRDGMGLCYDTKNDCLVLFGSQYDNDEKTWVYRYDTNRWEGYALTPHPVGRKLGTYSTIPRMAYDSVNGLCLCLTWDTNTGRHETWAFDAAKLAWTKMNPPVEPDASMSRSRNLAYSARDNVFILESSSKEGRGKAPQIWTYRLRNAPANPPVEPPSDLRVVTDRGQATLTWTAVRSAGEYRVYRAPADEPWKARFERVASVPGTTWADHGLSAGAAYFYTVRAVGRDGRESRNSPRARTQPRVLLRPVVSVLAGGKVEVSWNAHPAADVVGYNVYRGEASVRAVRKGTPGPWKDNDPEYSEPLPVEVRDVQRIHKLNERPIAGTRLEDKVDLSDQGVTSGRYRYGVYAYVVRAVNRLGTESGPSAYALSIPSEPANLLNREAGGKAQLRWDPSPEKGVVGYHVYKLEGTWKVVRLTAGPVKATTFTHEGGNGVTRYWVVAVDALGQEGQPSSPVWHNQSYHGFYSGEWHQ
jgi:fibronectin type 3 domain-containing protein